MEVQANYLNYKYNPASKKIGGLTQHAYLEELKTDHESDIKVFGSDPFQTKTVDTEKLQAKKKKGLGQMARATES